MPKPTKRARLDAIRACLERHGPLYVAALLPLDALAHWREDDYVPWFVSHTDEKALLPERIERLWELACRRDLICSGEEMEAFAHFLETRGYLVLTSAILGGPGYLTENRRSKAG